MSILVKKGQKVDMTKAYAELQRVRVQMYWKVVDLNPTDFEIDAAAFLLGATGKAEKDEDFIFYNNPFGADNCVTHISNPRIGGNELIKINLRTMPNAIERIAFTITINDSDKKAQSFKQVKDIAVRIFNEETNVEVLSYNISDAYSVETAIVAAEIYRYKGEWKFNAIGSGFKGGLGALCENFGISVEEENLPVNNGKLSTEKQKQLGAPTQPKINLSKINILKKKVEIVLEKKKLIGVVARVALVIDISRSMFSCYKEGKVQKVIDRIAAVAAKFDDDGTLDMWIFDHRFHRLPSVNESNYEDYINREILDKHKQGLFNGKIFGANDEPPVMEDVIKYYTEENKSEYPAFVVFISDGGIHKNKEIKQVMIESTKYPLFWQFIGIGNANYGILEKLDIMPGRVVDNANFFSLDDVDKISDEELYNKLLNEFPMWLKEVKEKGIL
ncbi:VWA domain-containing protein [Clostridium sp. CF012]|uniref:VWA domain-containing protein n=1 Tax=Clostridium sp. CF012 TaxID=2843319 RepID=UPI001C0C04CB|nr:VWA domain-containing protein [Clostridium sp. CF012]MBU3146203.1 VWA domain-containing protein [Clostridium sp. CF012]